jgi:hypothetical protein
MNNLGWRDFDFFHGKWRVAHRRLVERLAGSNEWQEFGGICICQPTLGGRGNFDDNILDLPGSQYRAMTIRSFDTETGRWSIWWLDARQPAQLDVPVVGSFDGDVGTFIARDNFQGRPVLVRFQWRKGAAPTWQQAMSDDDGESWEVNWMMRFTRDDGAHL